VALIVLSLHSAQAASATWNGLQNNNWIPSQTGGNQNWSTGNHMFPGAVNTTTNTDTATFNIAGGNPTITLNPSLIAGGTTLNVQSITFDTASVGAFTIGTTGGPTLRLTNGGTIQMTSTVANNETVNAPIELEPASSSTAGSYTFTNNASSSASVLSFGGTISGGSTAVSPILTLNGSNTGSNTISGTISNGAATNGVAVTKSGAGTWVLTGNNSYTGATLISNGTLNAGAAGALGSGTTGTSGITINSGGTLLLSGSAGVTDRIKNTAGITLNGGIFNTGGLTEAGGGTGTRTAGMGALTLTANSTIDFGTGNSIIEFAGLGPHVPITGADLAILNWTGTGGTAGGTDQLLFAGTTTDFTSQFDQSDVSFNGVQGYNAIQIALGYYEVVEVPGRARGWRLTGAGRYRIRNGNACALALHPRVNHFEFLIMPPKADPYATPLHRRIDTFLWIFSIVVAAIVFILAAH
jgi:autotransporter-associated beta strand protein